MKLLTYSETDKSELCLGVAVDDTAAVDIKELYEACFEARPPHWFDSVSTVLSGGAPAMELLRDVLKAAENLGEDARASAMREMSGITFHPPITHCGKILCITMNYSSHAVASSSQPSKQPFFFIKMPSNIVGHDAKLVKPARSSRCDSEIELGVIIGKRGKYISKDDAWDHVFGYAVTNDLSFRDLRQNDPEDPPGRLNWLMLKNLDTSAPIGPWIVTKDELSSIDNLEISLWLENEPEFRQTGNTRDMLHRIPEIIEYLSRGITLEPGDVICTGTPHAVAFGQDRFLQDGDIVVSEIEGVGRMRNPVVEEG